MDGRIEPKSTDADLEGLDDSQRAEVHEYEGGGPSDGDVLTDMARDRGEDFVEDERRAEYAPSMPEDATMTGGEYEDVPGEEADDE